MSVDNPLKSKRRIPTSGQQLNLYEHVINAYANNPDGLENVDLYNQVQLSGQIEQNDRERKPVGKSKEKHDLFARKVRWYQQTMKHLELLQKLDGTRGVWRLTGKGKKRLCKISSEYAVIGYSTKLGIAIWGDSIAMLRMLDEPIHLAISSPPYMLSKQRSYGNPQGEHEYIDFICSTVEPIVKNLVPGGSIVLNIGQDVFERGLPSRSIINERLTIAFCDRLGLHKMDQMVWHNKSKPPGPMPWASGTRQQLNVAWEPVLWFCNDPLKCRSDNRRVLEPHTATHMKLMAAGGESRQISNSDGAYVIRKGKSYSNVTPGRIPRNVLAYGHACGDQRAYKSKSKAYGLPAHGAPFPVKLIEFLVKFLSEEGDVVLDWFSGSFTVGRACENTKRRWIGIECMLEYVMGSSVRFEGCNGFWRNDGLSRLVTTISKQG